MALVKAIPVEAELVEITEVVNAGSVWVTASTTAVRKWSKSRAQLETIEMFLAKARLTSVPKKDRPFVKELVAVNERQTGKWHRGRVEATPLIGDCDYQVFLIDHGRTIEVSESAIRDIDAYYTKQEALAFLVLLFGIVPGKPVAYNRLVETPSWCYGANLLVKKQIAKSSLGYFFQKIENYREDVKYGKLFLVAEDGFIDLGCMLCVKKFAISNVDLFMKRIGADDLPSTSSSSNSVGFGNDDRSSPTEGCDESNVRDSVELQRRNPRGEQERTRKSVQPVGKGFEKRVTIEVEDERKLAHNNEQEMNANQGRNEDRERHVDTQDKIYRNNYRGVKFFNRVEEVQDSTSKLSSISSATKTSRKFYYRIPENVSRSNDETVDKSRTFRERNGAKSSGNFGRKVNLQKFAHTKECQIPVNSQEHLRENKPNAGHNVSSGRETQCENITPNGRYFGKEMKKKSISPDKNTRSEIHPKRFESSRKYDNSRKSHGYDREKSFSGKNNLKRYDTLDDNTQCNLSSSEERGVEKSLSVDNVGHGIPTKHFRRYKQEQNRSPGNKKENQSSVEHLLSGDETPDQGFGNIFYGSSVGKNSFSPEKGRDSRNQPKSFESPRSSNRSQRCSGERFFSGKKDSLQPKRSFDEDMSCNFSSAERDFSKEISVDGAVHPERDYEGKSLCRGANDSNTTRSEGFETSGRYDGTSSSCGLYKETQHYLALDQEISDKNTSQSINLREEVVEKKGVAADNDSENAIQPERSKVNIHILTRNVPLNETEKEIVLNSGICDVDYLFYDEKNVSKKSVSAENKVENKSNQRNFESFEERMVQNRSLEDHQEDKNETEHNSLWDDETLKEHVHHARFVERDEGNCNLTLHTREERFSNFNECNFQERGNIIREDKLRKKSERHEQVLTTNETQGNIESELSPDFIPSVNRKKKPEHIHTFYPAGYNMQEADEAFERLTTKRKSGSSLKSNCSNRDVAETLICSHRKVKEAGDKSKSAPSETNGCSKLESEDCGKKNKLLKQTNFDLEKKLFQSSISEIDSREENKAKSLTYEVIEKSTDQLSTSNKTYRTYLSELGTKVEKTEHMRELQSVQNCKKYKNPSESKTLVISTNILSPQPNIIEEKFTPDYPRHEMQKDVGKKILFPQTPENEAEETLLSPENRLLSAIKEYVVESNFGRISENKSCTLLLQQLLQNLSGVSEKEGTSNSKERESNNKNSGGLEISKVETTDETKMISSLEIQGHLQKSLFSSSETTDTMISSVDVKDRCQRVAGETIQNVQVTMISEQTERLHSAVSEDTPEISRSDGLKSMLNDSLETRDVQAQFSKLVQVQDIKAVSGEILENVSERGILKEDLETTKKREAEVQEDLKVTPEEDQRFEAVEEQNLKTVMDRNVEAEDYQILDAEKDEKSKPMEIQNLKTEEDGKHEAVEDKNLEAEDDGKCEAKEDWKRETEGSQNLVTEQGETIVSEDGTTIIEEQIEVAAMYTEDEDVILEGIPKATEGTSNVLLDESRNNKTEGDLGIDDQDDQKIEVEHILKQLLPVETEGVNVVLEESPSAIADEDGKILKYAPEVEADRDLHIQEGLHVEAESIQVEETELEIMEEDSDVVAGESPVVEENVVAEVSLKTRGFSEKKYSKALPAEENVVEISSRTESEKHFEIMTGVGPEAGGNPELVGVLKPLPGFLELEAVALPFEVSAITGSARSTLQTTPREISQTAYQQDMCPESKPNPRDILENKSTMPQSSSNEAYEMVTSTKSSSSVAKGDIVVEIPISKENNLSINARDSSDEMQESGKAPPHRSINVNPDPCSNLVLNTGRKIMDQLQLMIILLHGAPEGFRHLNVVTDAAFRIDIHKALKTIMNRLMRIQKYSWPLIQQGYSVIMVGPPMSGKTLGYAVPLLDLVMQNVHCNQIPKGNGPVSIILCSGSKSCYEIRELCDLFIRTSGTQIKVLVAYGGGAEKGIEFKLINGCHILITTPRCFKRLLAFGKVVVNFLRLKYLILDEADVLTLRFLPEVEFICKSVERDMRPQDKAQLQVVAAAEKWCPGLEGLMRSLSKPVVCIGAFMEALIYARLKPLVHFVTQGSRTAVVQEIMAKSAGKHRTLIVCQEVAEVEGVVEALTAYPQLLYAHDNMDTCDIHDVFVKWSWMEWPALVCTDMILQEMRIQGASQVVHFSLGAVSKREFAFRCSALIDHLPSLFESKEEKEARIDPQMHILISDTDNEPLPTLVSFLKRLGTPVDPDLQKRANAAEVEKELRKDCVPLCYNTKAFGDCWNRSKCVYRHVISSKDKPQNIPVSGTVKVKILYIHDTCNYSARLVEHVNEDGKVETIPNQIMSLARKLNSYFKEEGHRILLENPRAYDICASEKPFGVFHRTEILAITKADRFGRPTQLLVRYIDDGCRDLINADRVFVLPENIKDIPPQSVELFLCRLVPCDFDWSWGTITNNRVTSILSEAQGKGRFLVGKIKLSLSHMLWLDPLECFESLPTLKTSAVIFSVHRKLLDEKLAVENPQHLRLLYQACARGGVEVACNAASDPDKSLQITKSQENENVDWAHLPEDEFSLMYFIVGDHPGRFYMRQKKFEDLVHKLDKKLLKIVHDEKATDRTLFTGDYCIGRFPTDDRWYRARVENAQDDSLDLFFVDHGDRASVSRSEAVPLPKNLISQLPFQAIECCFAGVSPDMGDRWSEKSIDALYSITAKPGTADGVKLLYAKVLQKVKPADCTGGYKYHIALIEVTSHGRAMLNDTLVAWGLASQSDQQKLLLKSIDFSHLPPPVDVDPYESEEDEDEEEPCSFNEVDITFEENWNDTLAETSLSTGDANTSVNTSQSFSPNISSSSETSLVPAGFLGFNFDEVTEEEIMEFLQKSMEMYKIEQDKNSAVNTSSTKEKEMEEEKESKASTSTFQEISKSSKQDLEQKSELAKTEKDLENLEIKPSNTCDSLNSSIDDDMEECSSIMDDDDDYDYLMPPLLRTTRVPLIYWHQNAYFVWLRIDLPGVEKYHLKWDVENLHFWTKMEDLVYTFDLHLFGPINPHSIKHSGGLFVRIKMQKVVYGMNWLRLTVERKKLPWIKQEYNEENDSDIEDLHLSEQLRAVKEMEKKTKARTHSGGLLPADEVPYEEGEDDDDTDSSSSYTLLQEDEQYDPYDPMN